MSRDTQGGLPRGGEGGTTALKVRSRSPQTKDCMRLPPQDGRLTLTVPKELLRSCGFRNVVAISDNGLEYLASILDELEQDSCIHSWQGHLARAGEASGIERVRVLLQADQAQRPTQVFVYVGVREDGAIEPVGVAAVAERIRADFPYEGFPVMARAYIRHAYRGQGFYPSIVRQRLDYCVQEWGSRLRAVHLGSADPSVWRTVSRGAFFSAPFLFVGTEELHVGQETHRVRDFLAFTPGFQAELLESIEGVSEGGAAPEAVVEAIEALSRYILRGAKEVPYGELIARLEASRAAGWDAPRVSRPLRELLAFCDAIPLTR